MSCFEDKCAIVTGAASGIGRAVAQKFLELGARVVLADLDEQLLKETVRSLKPPEAGQGRARYFVVDVRDESSVQHLIAFTVEEFGDLHFAVNNAGIEGERAFIAETTVENWEKVMDTNAKGVFLCLKYELAQMKRQLRTGVSEKSRGYAVVNTASTAGQAGMPEFCAYSASKHAVISLTKTAAKEYAGDNIRVNAVCPSTTRTAMVERFSARWPVWQQRQNESIPMGRIGEPEEVAEAIAWLCTTGSSFVTGACITMDGGQTA